MNKKGSGLVNPNPQSMIALLVFIIGGSLILYIMFLPPQDRADLLEQNRTALGLPPLKDKITLILMEEPGRLSNIPDTEIFKSLPEFNLFTRTDATSLIDFDSIYIKKSLYEEQQRNITFKIDKFDDTDNFILSFNAPTHVGMMTIILNGNILTSKEFTTESPSPIKLPKDFLQQQNFLVFKVSGPGVEFWKNNEYILENLKITADVTDRSSQENQQMVLITEQEKDNLESFKLAFAVDCREIDNAPLEVYLNKRIIFSGVPDCGSKVLVPEVDESRLRKGENELLFRTEKGNYLIYNVETKLKLKEPIFPTYYFTINDDDFALLSKNQIDVNVTLLFPNSEDQKKGILLVNDYFVDINTYEAKYSRNVNGFVRRGNNAVEIRPKQDKMDVLELKVIKAE
ncbi:MAG: hypothetical protein NDI94_00395 [Candidatus Woesearchaeota archaeon]|nr:hypothetical protein [Candidatus Woesearchaeota archaeon]